MGAHEHQQTVRPRNFVPVSRPSPAATADAIQGAPFFLLAAVTLASDLIDHLITTIKQRKRSQMQRYLAELQDEDGSDNECAVDEEEDEEVEGPHLNEEISSAPEGISEIIDDLLWIGDFQASQSFDNLKALGISVVVAAMRQRYRAPEGITVHQVPIEDNNRTNVIAHFSRVNEIIAEALARKQGVLVHCQAGISRSTTLVAAYLMHAQGLTCDEAVERISTRRSVTKPTEFFLYQLEMYERMGCEVDPAHHSEYRRFLMNFHHESMMDGDGGETLFLAYYPSPATTPRSRSPSVGNPFSDLRMTPFDGSGGGFTSIQRTSSQSSAHSMARPHRRPSASSSRSVSMTDPERPRRRRSSRFAEETREAIKAEAQAVREGKATLLKVGQGQGRVVVKGKRIRCKMCNRELAARQHLVEHEPGQGQQAFAPRRRDMAQHRQEMAQRKAEEARKAERKLAKMALAMSRSEPAPAPDVDNTPTPPDAVSGGVVPKQPAPEVDLPRSGSSSKLADRLPSIANLRVALPPPFRLPSSGTSTPATLDGDTPSPAAAPSPPLLPHSDTCHSYFVEPLSWMQDQLADGELGGRIVCPNTKCQAKLGSFDWAGMQCSCGSWVVPGFALQAAKVDEVSG